MYNNVWSCYAFLGDIIELRGNPKACIHQAMAVMYMVAGVMTLGKVKAIQDDTMDNPQPSCLYGVEGSETKW